ncbi:cysteine synthase family protein [Lysinibacillus sp. JNUCC 51]|uniref:cysteine synthase family protein n=1 Tax=Lysinibacillus sp. JNUCC-51 TaxID=2792479 RepID=UPI0019388F7C|nr:cysteine synthase family protein [Lysinibacillus sp. JNUCC-51]
MYKNSILDIIGETPLISLTLDSKALANVYGKLELQNPYGMKDRVAKNIILKAKEDGLLLDGAPIIESSSGTMALGLALVGTYLGHEVHIVTDPRIDSLTKRKLKALGANLHVVNEMEKIGGWQKARLIYLNKLLERMPNAFWPQQYENINNPNAYNALADEAVEKIGKIDYLVGSVGSGGSLCGTAKALKKRNPNIKVVGVDAIGSSIFLQNDNPKRLQSGLGNSIQPKNVDHSLIDYVHWLNDEEAFNWTRELASQEKIFAGNSSGSVYAVSRWLSRNINVDLNILCIFPDRGDRYFETIYDDDFYNKFSLSKNHLNLNPKKENKIEVFNNWTFVNLKKVKTLETV